jgi:protein-S-isoprenylcysteine O-methyltransferase Ste14
MNDSENPKNENNRGMLLPKGAVPFVWAFIVLVIQVLLPWVAALIGPRFGWVQGAPAWWNLAGLIPVALGLGLYTWCLVFHYRSYRESVRVSFSPPHLVVAGPYQISRNPMYVSGLIVWLGWVLFYGSPVVFATFILLWAVFSLRVIPHEESLLEGLFGDEYLAYKGTVRRWLGRY